MNVALTEIIDGGNYTSTGEIIQILEDRLLDVLSNVDRGTRDSVNCMVSKCSPSNRLYYLADLINKIENALDTIDVRLLNVKHAVIKSAATAISCKITEYSNKSSAIDAEHLIKLFYAIGNTTIQAPKITLTKNNSQEKYLKNIQNQKWWINKLVKNIGQSREHLRLMIGMVNGKAPYASDSALTAKKYADKIKREYLEATEFISKTTGKSIPLINLTRTEEQKFSEIYGLLMGVDKYAQINQLSSALITITAPSEFHISSSNYNSITPKDISQAILKKWSKCTKDFLKIKHDVYAFQVSEFHVDGTPHSHVLIYFPDEFKNQCKSILQKHFEVDRLEGGLVDWIDVDRKKGTCIGYLVKTLVPADENNLSIDSFNNERVAAARKLWQLRSFNHSGLPKKCIATWRELRKLTDTITSNKKVSAMLKHVKSNNFYDFFKAYKNKEIFLLLSDDKKTIGVEIYGVSIVKQLIVKQKTDDNFETNDSKKKVNSTNYPSFKKETQEINSLKPVSQFNALKNRITDWLYQTAYQIKKVCKKHFGYLTTPSTASVSVEPKDTAPEHGGFAYRPVRRGRTRNSNEFQILPTMSPKNSTTKAIMTSLH